MDPTSISPKRRRPATSMSLAASTLPILERRRVWDPRQESPASVSRAVDRMAHEFEALLVMARPKLSRQEWLLVFDLLRHRQTCRRALHEAYRFGQEISDQEVDTLAPRYQVDPEVFASSLRGWRPIAWAAVLDAGRVAWSLREQITPADPGWEDPSRSPSGISVLEVGFY